MKPIGSGGEDDSRCPRCRQFLEITANVCDRVDTIESSINAIKRFIAENEWVLVENAENIKQFRHPDKEIEPESLQLAFAQAARFERLILMVSRAVDRMTAQCEDFAAVNAKTSTEES